MSHWFWLKSFLTTVVTYLQYIYLYLSVSFLIWQKNMVDWANLSTDPSQQQPQSKVLSILWVGLKMCVFWLFWHVKGNFLHNFDEPGKKWGFLNFLVIGASNSVADFIDGEASKNSHKTNSVQCFAGKLYAYLADVSGSFNIKVYSIVCA